MHRRRGDVREGVFFHDLAAEQVPRDDRLAHVRRHAFVVGAFGQDERNRSALLQVSDSYVLVDIDAAEQPSPAATLQLLPRQLIASEPRKGR